MITTIVMDIHPRIPASFLRPNVGGNSCWFGCEYSMISLCHVNITISLYSSPVNIELYTMKNIFNSCFYNNFFLFNICSINSKYETLLFYLTIVHLHLFFNNVENMLPPEKYLLWCATIKTLSWEASN